MLEIANLEAGYGSSQALFGVSFAIAEGEVVTLLGRNGMGKTTTVRAVMGLLPAWKGSIRFGGAEVTRLPPHRVAQRGIGLVPEGRMIFPTLTVEENLVATAAKRAGSAWTLVRVYELFPQLVGRRHHFGGQLSGGEQQMTVIGRALMTNPALLILDEATEGLAPLVRGQIWAALDRLRAEKLSILVIDKNLDALVRLADRHVVMEKGRVVWAGSGADLACDRATVEKHLHV
jgi:branched-chain amino acid transport system ATP-binding protein